ncbi:unnamed protein product [Adineta steineri]|uniref:SET domain-containing protein n=1 Tax=Adineta steineri TaxID=433720 RepID=A0A820GP04_9BILA|nr:unnamed protein product [Adineta steineri]
MLKYLFGQRSSYLNVETINKVQSLCRSIENQIDENKLHEEFLELFHRLLNSPKEKSPRNILQEQFHFSLNKGLSQTHSQGIFLDYGQIKTAGQLVAIYPGTIYHRHFDPLLLASIQNTFLLARKDNLIIDGRDQANGLPNVTYYEFDFNFNESQQDLYGFVPNVRYADLDNEKGMPSAVLISLRPIEQGEELFSCYYNVIQQEKQS